MRFVVLICCVAFVGCGSGDEAEDADIEDVSQEALGESEERPFEDAGDEPVEESSPATVDRPTLTEIPDPCAILTRADAEEILGVATTEGMSFDAGGWNCVYDTTTSPRRRLVFDMYADEDRAMKDTQIGMSAEACEAEMVRPVSNLGLDAALYRNAAERCGGETWLWVLTDTVFQGAVRPMAEREITGHVHFTVTISPTDEQPDAPAKLRSAAERAIDRLPS